MEEAVENIRKFRELKNLTREQMADLLQMSSSGYAKLERGDVDITLKRLYQIAQVLEVSVSQILSFDASQVFHISNENGINNVSVKEQAFHYYQDETVKKYISVLEKEIDRLRGEGK